MFVRHCSIPEINIRAKLKRSPGGIWKFGVLSFGMTLASINQVTPNTSSSMKSSAIMMK